jgi:spore germination cell wall hydrolase CwlJ-like protein
MKNFKVYTAIVMLTCIVVTYVLQISSCLTIKAKETTETTTESVTLSETEAVLESTTETTTETVIETTTEIETTVYIETTTVEPTTVKETTTVEETTSAPTETEQNSVDQDELYLLAHLINAEAGSSWCSDELQIYVVSVVLNRMASSSFPNTMYGVIYQSGQYACTWDGNFEKEPTERAWRNAEYVLTNGSQLPSNVLYQAQFKQGSGVHCQIGDTYFCYY